MSGIALNNLWVFIQSMGLSDRNKQWLADRLIESKSSTRNGLTSAVDDADLLSAIQHGRDEINKGECITCATSEELNTFLCSL